jgi:hypothetical protein
VWLVGGVIHVCVVGHSPCLESSVQEIPLSGGRCPLPHGFGLHLHKAHPSEPTLYPKGQAIRQTGVLHDGFGSTDITTANTAHKRKTIVRRCIVNLLTVVWLSKWIRLLFILYTLTSDSFHWHYLSRIHSLFMSKYNVIEVVIQRTDKLYKRISDRLSLIDIHLVCRENTLPMLCKSLGQRLSTMKRIIIRSLL